MEIVLSPEQEAEAQRIEQALVHATRGDLRRMARLVASKEDRHLLGETEFQIRDVCHPIGATVVQTALGERKKGGTKDPASPAPAAEGTRPSRAIAPRGS